MKYCHKIDASLCFPDYGLGLCFSNLMLVCQSSKKVAIPVFGYLFGQNIFTSVIVLNCHSECCQYGQT